MPLHVVLENDRYSATQDMVGVSGLELVLAGAKQPVEGLTNPYKWALDGGSNTRLFRTACKALPSASATAADSLPECMAS